MKKLLSITLMITALFLMSCGDDDNDVQKQLDDIIELAQANGFNSLAAALTRADLVDDLQGQGPFTVFAPTDAAFASLLSAVGQTSVNDVPINVLEEILLYHVVSGQVFSKDVADGDVNTLNGDDISLSTSGGISVNGVDVVGPFDVEASNGVIHTIDGVLVPGDVAQFVDTVLEPAYFNVNFTTLVSAVVQADLVNTLLTTSDLTIFAPTNQAFTDANIDPSTFTTDEQKMTLANVLKYHVVTPKTLSNGLPGSIETLSGGDIYFSSTDNGTFINSNSKISAIDIESGSGVVHVIDKVLIEPTKDVVSVAVDFSQAQEPEFTSLVAALTRTTTEGEVNLIDVLTGDGPFTVFAPTDAAFAQLLVDNEWESLDDIDINTLVQVLKYHVVPGKLYDIDLGARVDATNQVTTVQGQTLTFDLSELTINDVVNIGTTNVEASNGVIHVIDKVLLPELE